MIAEAIWHDVENGAYAADLALWERLAAEGAGPVLELGAGTGRVTLELAGHGHDITALDSSQALIGSLRSRADAAGLEIETEVADARDFNLGRRFATILAPMQFAHIVGGGDGRARMLAAVSRHLNPGGTLAAALLDEEAVAEQLSGPPPLPDVREVDGWVYSSLPTEVIATRSGYEVRRLRQSVSPTGELSERTDSIHLDTLSPAELEAEAATAGLEARERIPIAATADHVGSVVCVLERPR
jgi:SAM-dependent methyltransferase